MIFNDKVKAEIENCINSRDRKKKDLRAQFLMTGFVYDPNNSYRIEFRFKDHRTANKVIKELRDFKLIAKISVIDKRELYVVYLADNKSVMELLKILGAKKSLNKYEKIVQKKNKISNINRIVNFETANIKKSVDASLKELDDIKKLLKIYKFKDLDYRLQEVITARRKYKTLSLSELAKKMGNISKNTLSKRFNKIKLLLGE